MGYCQDQSLRLPLCITKYNNFKHTVDSQTTATRNPRSEWGAAQIYMVCDILAVTNCFDDDNLVEETMPPTTDYLAQEPRLAQHICAATAGAYNGAPLEIEIRMPFGSDFDVAFITCYDSEGASQGALTMTDLTPMSDYTCTLEGDGVSSGTFGIDIVCTSDAPTRSPSAEPTENMHDEARHHLQQRRRAARCATWSATSAWIQRRRL